MSNAKKIAIIGGGASALIASIFASKNNNEVTIFEKNNKIGKKILATGNGRCNITNNNIQLKYFHSKNIDIVKKILNQFDENKTTNFFKSIGLLTRTSEKKYRLYPMSFQASSVVNLLEIEAKKNKVDIKINSHVSSVKYLNNQFHIIINESLQYIFDKVIVATGSYAQKKLGGCHDGYNFAQQFNHTIIPIAPSLVQLTAKSKYLNEISGVKCVCSIKLFSNNMFLSQSTGDLLFTKYGLSGSSVLEISREVSISIKKQHKIHVSIDLFPNYSENELYELLNDLHKQSHHENINFFLEGLINKKLINMIVNESNILNEMKISKNSIYKISKKLKKIIFNIDGTKGYDFCEVCSGGVNLNEINYKNMESLKQNNLYFCGEVLDVDGDCGGFNLQWAWSSGFLAGNNI